MNPLVSVIVPIYKVEPYLQRCVSSIQQQTYENLEIILVDDGSPDRCGQMCDEIKETDNRVHVIHQEKEGLSEARNVGIENSLGEYILFVDSDDWIVANTVERLLSACIEADADVVCCGHYRDNGKTSDRYPLTEEQLTYENDLLMLELKGVFASFAWNKLWKKELFNDIRFPAGRLFEDLSTNWRIFSFCSRVTVVSDVLFHYTVRKDSISNSKSMKNLADLWIAFKERYDALAEENEEYLGLCVKHCLDTIAYTWRWLHGVSKRDRAEYETEIQQMKAFLKEHQDSIKNCPTTTRISLFFAVHSSPVTIVSCYYLNQVFRQLNGKNHMVFER